MPSAPALALTDRLARIVAEALERDEVAVDQDLFALGMDSLGAAQILARVHDECGASLSLDELFEAASVAALARLVAGHGAFGEAAPLGRRGPGAGPLPLSFAQRRLWFLHQLEPENPVHNLAAAVRAEGRLDAAALAAALSEIVRRHEALRTGFALAPEGGGPAAEGRENPPGRPKAEPVQVVQPAAPLALPLVDLAALPPPARAAEARRVARGLGRLPFDLARGRVVRAALLRREAADHELVLALHHVAGDGGSLAILAGELAALYASFVARRPSPLPEPPLQYADYALWQRRLATDETLAPSLAWWRERLAGLPLLELPADRPRPAVLSHRGAHSEHALAAGLSAPIEDLARGGRATPFMVLLAAFAALLARATGEADLAVGTPVDGRRRVELEGLVGVFLDNLVLRLPAERPASFRELLGGVREAMVGAFAHQDLPFERLVDALSPARDLSRTPLFQVLFVGQNARFEPIELPGLRLTPRELDLGTARFDLAVSMAEVAGIWHGTWKLSTDLFDPPTIARLAGQYERLLAAALAAPATPLRELPLLSPAERHQVLLDWNDTASRALAERAETRRLHELIAEQAARTPGAVAVVDEAEALDYRELLGRAGALAARLRSRGVGPGSRVGVAAERSVGMVAGLLGVLLAGAAYVPLDPDYPRQLLGYLLEDSGVDVLLLQSEVAARLGPLPERLAGRSLDLEAATAWPGPGAPEIGRSDLADDSAGPASVAYVIYTSGSTGRPKGAAVPHRGIVNRLLWMQDAYRLTADDRVLQKTPFSFDVSVWELFWPFLAGARLVMAPPGAHQDPARLAAWIEAHGITTLHFVPSMLQVFLDQPGAAAACASVRQVFASGEALPWSLQERFRERLPGVELHNLYGPTEASVDVTYHACRGGDRRRTVPIGRPIANTRILLLDPDREPVPAGVAGELHIGGVGLAEGYLGRPEMTAERFVPDPFGEHPGGRLYRTGDLARFRPDGEVEFLGRADHQVKLRGFRIEPGEIEAALDSHPAVRESVVVVRRDGETPRLVGYLVPRRSETGERLLVADLRAFLTARLPRHMVPQDLVALDALPLSPNGKVDRRALPAPPAPEAVAPDAEGSENADVVAEPRTPVESRLLELWRSQLGDPRLGVHDSFFAAGGDSIQGAMLVNRIQRELDAVVYVMALFDHPTAAAFARHLEASYRPALVAAGWRPDDRTGGGEEAGERPEERDDAADLAALARHLATRFSPRGSGPPAAGATGTKNRRAIFILSPFRSGSTLLRVMLAGHPRLFAPPELELLGFATLGQRRRVLAGRDRFAREGLLRALLALPASGARDAEAAAALVAAAEAADEPTPELYRRLQEWAGDRLLVDKTPRYSLDRATLERAESWFEAPLYVHLVRHPAATVQSYLEARMDEVYRFPLPPRRQAELVWRLAHETILGFLDGVPEERRHRLRFEDLVRDPEGASAALCRFLGVPFDPALLSPYEGERMADGLHAHGRMMGDPNFLRHRTIEAAAAERWRSDPAAARLGEATWRLAGRLGYADARPAAPIDSISDPAGESPRPLPRAPGEEAELPLSFAQQRLWFLDRLGAPGSGYRSAYNMSSAVRLDGPLAVPALSRAAAEIERRHEVLRTTFPAAEGRPRQVVGAPRGIFDPGPLAVVDLGALAAPAGRAEASRLAGEEIERPFDLAAGPLWRLCLLRLAEREHVLVVGLHHIVGDGWSIGVLARELARGYAAFREGRPSPLPALPLQYADYALWQRRRLAGERLAEHLGYWRERLTPLPPVLELPTDRPRPPVQTYRGRRRGFRVPAAVVQGLRARARKAEATLFVVLVAAGQALLHRYTGEEDVTLATPVANRNRIELEELIGLFVNTLVLRTDLTGDPGFDLLVGRAREVSLGAARHEELPFERLVEELGVERSLGRTPLFSAMLALQNAPPAEIALAGLAIERLAVGGRTAKLDLTFELTERPDGGLDGVLEYNTDLFDAATAARLTDHLASLLADVGAAGGSPRLSALRLLGAAELHQTVVEANDSALAAPALAAGETVCDLVAASVRRRPEALAIAGGEGHLTYGELAARATRLARRLARLGAGPEVPVALYLERRPELLVALLGVLASGAAYLPLDTSHPPRRLAHVLADSAASLLLTERALLPALPPHGARVVLLDEEEGEPETAPTSGPSSEPSAPFAARALPEGLAYVIYTSGSTGLPKGVGVRHRGLVNYLESMARRPGLGEADVVLALTTLAFDIAATELLLPLAVGARIEIVGRETAVDSRQLAAAIDAAEATVVQATPSAWGLLLDGGWAGRPGLTALAGGEALPRPLADRLAPRVAALWNVYGPTETTVWSTLHPVGPGGGSGWGRVPIGRPLGNTQVHLLGRHLELVPPSAAGELAIGGLGLARGYQGRPELTAERFVPDPFAAAPGGRLYRTGDLARRAPDGGSLEYLGRADQQVKVRGVRIELGEIEAALAEHPAVARCAVTAADGRLAAYVVAAGGAPPREELAAFLRERLPGPMVPAAFVFLDRLPLLASGKVDRRALPDPGRDRPELAAAYALPQNERERQVAEIWQETLGLDRVGIHDNFFDLGGHSLAAAEVQAKLRERLGVEVELIELFRHPTIHALARALRAAETGGEPAPDPAAAPAAPQREAVRRRRQALARLRQTT